MSGRVVSALFGLVLAVACAYAPAHAQDKRIALLIGNQTYDASVGVLKNPHNDIALVAEALTKQGFEILPPVKDARRSGILTAVRDLVRQLNAAGAGAVGFLYYSGHGAAEKDTNLNYLIPVDAKDPGSTQFWDESLKLDDIMKLLEGARGAVKFVVFDACRNELQLPTRDTSKGLVPVAEQQGFFVAYASAPGRTASDRGATSGPYAAALAKELGRKGLDHLNLFQNVKETVIATTGGSQHPWESNGLTKRVYLTGEPTMPADMALWDSVSKSSDVPSLQRYLERFPDGVFAGTARLMIERLNAEAAQRQQAEAERKAQDAKQAANLQLALDEARKAREALAAAEKERVAAAQREADLRQAQQALQTTPTRTGDQAEADRVVAAALAQRTAAAADEARIAREALAAAEAKQKEAEVRLAALEKTELDRKTALELLAKTDEAAARRASVDLGALQKAQEETLQRMEIRVGLHMSINDQCKVQPPPSIEILKKPSYGKIVIREGQGVINSVLVKHRQHCIGTKGNARITTYVLDEKHRERTDIDTFTLRNNYLNGIIDIIEFEVDVSQRRSTRTKLTRQQ